MAAEVGVVMAASFSTMVCGARLGTWLGPEARKAVSYLYSTVVFPAMVFRGVAAIDLSGVDWQLMLTILLSKLAVAMVCLLFGIWRHGSQGLPHAAAYAMAASHSFDVTLGAPMAKVLFPVYAGYIYLNQSTQLVAVNPLLLILMEIGGSRSKGASISSTVASTVKGVATNPLVLATLVGLASGRAFPAGLPPVLAALSKQIADAGPFLGFVSLGLAMNNLSATSGSDVRDAAVLCAAKLVLMPLCYAALGSALGVTAPMAFLVFLGSLPASASVYSLTLTRGLSPRVVGPLVPVSMLLSVALSLLPNDAKLATVSAPAALRLGIGALAALSLLVPQGAVSPRPHAE